MKEKRRLPVFWVLWLVVAMTGAIYAMESVSFSVPFVLGKVDIRLEQFCLKDGQEMEWSEVESVLPGQYISWVPRVYNEGEPCYIRARLIVFDGEKQEQKELEELLAAGMNSCWQQGADGYWYYPGELKRGDSAEVFSGIEVPKSLSQETWEERQLICGVHVEAIQSENVKPDLKAEMPWGMVSVLEYQEEEGIEIVYVEPVEKALQIIYSGATENWLTNGAELFTEVSYFMPGGVYCDELTIFNENSQDLFLYMSGEVVKGPQWLKEIGLTIRSRCGDEEVIVYEGTMALSDGEEKMLLQRIPSNGHGQLFFEIRVPESLDNSYIMQPPQIEWTFYGQAEEEQDREHSDVSGTLPQPGGKAETGDTSAMEWIVASLVISLLAMGCLVVWKKGRMQDE